MVGAMVRVLWMATLVTAVACDSGSSGSDVDSGISSADASVGGVVDAAAAPGTDAPVGAPDAAAGTPDAAAIVDAAPSPDALVLPPPLPGEVTAPPYLMWVTDTEVSVRWETSADVVGRVDVGDDSALGASFVETEAGRTHELRLTGLTPDSTQHYQISWGTAALPIETFRTAPVDRAISFIVFGDNQDGPDNFTTLVPHMVATDPDFAMSTGDCVQNGTRGEYREQLFEPIGPLAKNVPFLVAAGNHERYSNAGADLFDEYMSQPADEHCFGWRYGELFIMFIDTELSIDPGSPQNDCIVAALSSPEATSATFRAAAFHKPPRIEWWFGGALAFIDEMEAPWVRETLEPLLESLDVDIVFNGHNHLYTHTPETAGGITWVTTGGAGGSLDTDFFLWNVGDWPEIETTIHEHHFLSVTVDSAAITVRAIDLDGALLHEFTVPAS